MRSRGASRPLLFMPRRRVLGRPQWRPPKTSHPLMPAGIRNISWRTGTVQTPPALRPRPRPRRASKLRLPPKRADPNDARAHEDRDTVTNAHGNATRALTGDPGASSALLAGWRRRALTFGVVFTIL